MTEKRDHQEFFDQNPCGWAVCTTCPTAGYTIATLIFIIYAHSSKDAVRYRYLIDLTVMISLRPNGFKICKIIFL